ncbi:DUF2059 domain-containing protein [Flavobacterium sp.]|uniref:DUF2059 domain-containing protein n=1 Tax=Flavobacterium sp. TaxID=239 RepID=UPI003753AE64
MKKFIITLALVLVAQFGFSQVDEAFKKDVLKVIEKSGAGGQVNAAKKQILTMIPAEKQAAFLVEFDVILNKIQDETSKIYMQEYTKEDVKAMLAFYESPVGKKMSEKAEVLSTKSQESMMSVQTDVQELMGKYMGE